MSDLVSPRDAGSRQRSSVGDVPARATVGVVPARERGRRARLLDALEAVYPVRFEGREPGEWRGIDGLLALGQLGAEAAARSAGIPTLIATGEEGAAGGKDVLTFAHHNALARPLRAARLTETHLAGLPALAAASGEHVLADIAGSPAWVARTAGGARHDQVAAAPQELRCGEVLRNRLRAGRCLAALALTQFVMDLTAGRRWQVPRPRAAFVIDDPNLRWPTYGHIDYTTLSRSAADHGYHVAMAMVPLDTRPAHPRAIRLFREGRANLSVCIHGNDHDGHELARPKSCAEGLGPAAQALRRALAFEGRTGVTVDRVMVAPHERMSEGALAALLACGFEAFSGARPYPWISESPDLPWLTRPDDAGPLPGWGSAEVMPGGLPLLMRMDFGHPREELVIRAFLGQPVILYGHHDLLQHGPEVLEAMAAEINRLGDVRWSSLSGIARAAMETRRGTDVLELRMLGRRVSAEVPDGVSEVRIDTDALTPSPQTHLLVRTAAQTSVKLRAAGRPLLRVDRPGRIELRLDGAIHLESVPAPPRRVRPLVRRLAAEWRDRSRPALVSGRR